MKIINIDEFRPKTKVVLYGKEYTVNGFTVQMYLDHGNVLKTIKDTDDTKGQIEMTINLLMKLTDIPHDVLFGCTFADLYCLLAVCQGIDPTLPGGEAQGEEKK